MRKFLLTTAVVIGVLVIVVVVLAATPLGWNLAAGLLERSVERSTGLELDIGAVRGNLLSNVALTDVSLSVPEGPALVEIDRVAARYVLLALLGRRVVVPAARLEGVKIILETGVDGRIVGWSDVDRSTDEGAERGEPFAYEVSFVLDDLSVTYRNNASGLVVDALDASVRGEASEGVLEATIAGSLQVAAPGLAEPATGRISARAAREGDSVLVGPVLGRSRGFELSAFGEVAFPPRSAGGVTGASAVAPTVLLDVKSSIELAEAARLIGPDSPALAAIDGTVTVRAKANGPIDSLAYSASVTSDEVTLAGVGASGIDIEVAGDRAAVEVTRFSARFFEGTITASARADLAAARLDSATVPFSVRARIDDVSLSRLADLASAGPSPDGPNVAGALRASVEVSGRSLDVAGLRGSFEAGVAGLSVRGTEFGDLAANGSLEGGELLVDGVCCSTRFNATAALGGETMGSAAFSLASRDLSVLGTLFGAPELAGTGIARGSVSGIPETPVVALDADLPDVSYGDISIGPATAHVEGGPGGIVAAWTAFGRALTGQGSVDSTGRYEASLQMDELDLSAVVPDSVREVMALGGAVSARVDVAGDSAAVNLVEGTVSDLWFEARGHGASLDSPFRFRGTSDSLSATWISLTSDLGGISLTGSIGTAESGRIAARFREFDLAALSDFAPDGLDVPVEGELNGSVDLTGSLDRPLLVADVSLEDFSVAGLAFDSVILEADGDTSDIVFDVSATSPVAGSIRAYGAIPVMRDSVTLWTLDSEREFGASAVCDGFVIDAGPFLPPSVKGAGTLSANGSVLMSGRVDSLGSLRGRGRFDELSATFDLLRLAAADTLEFEIGGGGVAFTDVLIGVTRRRVLGDEAGGIVKLAGSVRRDQTLDVTVSAEGLDVGQILRTFAPAASSAVSGELSLEAVVTGTVTDPTIEFACEMAAPVIYDLAFDGAAASGSVGGDRVSLDVAELRAGGRAVTANGFVVSPRLDRSGEPRPGSGTPELDIRVVTAGFDLSRVRPRRADVDRLGGVVDADLRLLGSPSAPRLEGTLTLRDGRLEGLGLAEPVRAVAVEISASDGTIALSKGRARMGKGAVDVVGFVTLVEGGDPTFWLRTKLQSAEIAVDGEFDARLGGSIVWAGSVGRSRLSGTISVEDARVTHDVGLLDAFRRRPIRVIVTSQGDPMANVELDLEIDIEDRIEVRNNVASVDLRGGFHLSETFYAVEVSGGLYAEGGNFRYLENEFALEALSMAFIDPRRRDPYVDLLGTTDVTDRAGESYIVTLRFRGFLYDAVPELSSSPPLSEPDVVALLTFGDTVGWLVTGDGTAGSSGDRFVGLARRAFLSSVFGVAESTLERFLHLDTVAIDDEAVLAGDVAGADVTLGKEFGDRLRVNYTTAVGRFSDQRVEVSFRLTRRLSIETRADPEGNHAIDLRLRLPFR